MTHPTVADSKNLSRIVWSIHCPNCNIASPLHEHFAEYNYRPLINIYNCYYCNENVNVIENNLLNPECKEEE